MNKERMADAATGAAWTLWGISLAQINEVLTAISLVAATVASICAAIYYLRTRK